MRTDPATMKEESHILPFLWIHGEAHDVYREMIKAIHDAGISEFCVEARPHKEFCGCRWWDDMEAILSEAEKYSMRVWILDDKHFPTGYANGGIFKAPVERRRRHLCHRRIHVKGGKTARLNLRRLIKPRARFSLLSLLLLLYGNNMRFPKKFKDDSLLSCTAWKRGSSESPVDLSPFIRGGKLAWEAPVGDGWTVEICSLSRNTGTHRNYINMLDAQSCRIQIDEVYEPHYAHFAARFGNTIAGFFSDEPELGNGVYINHGNVLGTEQSLPYSDELASMLEERLGPGWKLLMPLLWMCGGDPSRTARVRYIYMDCVTRLVEEAFSRQIGEWCRERGVGYIGHVIEDNNQHARTSTSLGHFFRGLKWQTMSGIDDIGGQVYPGGEDSMKKSVLGFTSDGEFYHYALGKLGVSLGVLNPRMNGRTMCEVFGNYGWGEGVRLEKYLLDHFMVRGVNYFVPHAFTCKAYPDKDCPPHFYAHGNNPQYRHFGALMQYGQRVCGLISEGRIDARVAILYHAEAEWSGECMLMQKPARALWDNNIDFTFVPCDVFSERSFYRTEIGEELTVNGNAYALLVVPYSQFIPLEAAAGICELLAGGCKTVFIDGRPQGCCSGETLPEAIGGCDVVALDALAEYCADLGLRGFRLSPASSRLRCMHYYGSHELYYLFNEGGSRYDGVISLPLRSDMYEYDAWNGRAVALDRWDHNGESHVNVALDPSKSLIIICGSVPEGGLFPAAVPSGRMAELSEFTQSVCRSLDYPAFDGKRGISKLESYSATDKKFSGFIRYETSFALDRFSHVALEITDAYEGVEVFVNGASAGIQIVPVFMYDLTALCRTGENNLAIEVATTLERERGKIKNAAPTGITGSVRLYVEEGPGL